jgi:cytochrome c oxidase cbb3-type subunit III
MTGAYVHLTCAFFLVLFATACGKPKPEPLIPQELTDFNALYAENCAGCHGANGQNGAAQSLNNALYLALVPKDTFRQVTENGLPGSLMPGFAESSGGSLTKKQIDVLVDGIEKWASPDGSGFADLPPYSATSKGDANAGSQVFQAACAPCHGNTGKAGSLTEASFLELTTNQSLRTTIIAGRPQFGMPDWKHVMPQHVLTSAEIDNVVAYLSAQRPGGTASDQASMRPSSTNPSSAPQENR